MMQHYKKAYQLHGRVYTLAVSRANVTRRKTQKWKRESELFLELQD